MRRSRFRGFFFSAALLALAGQVAFGASLPQPVLARIAFGQLCQAGAGSHAAGGAPARPQRHVPLGAASPLCLVGALLPTPPLAAGPSVPPPRTQQLQIPIALPTVSALPIGAPRSASPRGPPTAA